MKRANKGIPKSILMTKYNAITARKPVILHAIVENELLTMVDAQRPITLNSSRETGRVPRGQEHRRGQPKVKVRYNKQQKSYNPECRL